MNRAIQGPQVGGLFTLRFHCLRSVQHSHSQLCWDNADSPQGTFGPMASAFNICSLSQSWSSTVHLTWLVIITATSLAFGLMANVSLLLAMTERLPMRIADPVSILGWYSASSMLAISAIVLSKHFQCWFRQGLRSRKPTIMESSPQASISALLH